MLALKRERGRDAHDLKKIDLENYRDLKVWKSEKSPYGEKFNKLIQNRTDVLGWKKTEKTLSDVCRSCQSLCAKWCGRVFKNEFLRHAHTTYHVTALLQTSERKNNGLESLKTHCRVKYTCDPLGVQPQDPKI